MTYTSIISTPLYSQPWPEWFIQRYQDRLSIASQGLSSLQPFEIELQLFEDIQKVIGNRSMVVACLHECGGISRVQINQEEIVFTEPIAWDEGKSMIWHDDCTGCADVELVRKQRNKAGSARNQLLDYADNAITHAYSMGFRDGKNTFVREFDEGTTRHAEQLFITLK